MRLKSVKYKSYFSIIPFKIILIYFPNFLLENTIITIKCSPFSCWRMEVLSMELCVVPRKISSLKCLISARKLTFSCWAICGSFTYIRSFKIAMQEEVVRRKNLVNGQTKPNPNFLKWVIHQIVHTKTQWIHFHGAYARIILYY